MLGKTHGCIGAMSGVFLLPYMKDIPITHVQFMDSLANLITHYFPYSRDAVIHGESVFDQRLSEITAICVATFAAYVPDADCPNSKLAREIAPVKIGNRRITFILIAIALWYITYLGYLPYATGAIFSLWLGLVAFMKHRGVTHSLVGLFLTYMAVLFLDPSIATAFEVGYASHILADMLTDRGVPLFWPYKIRIKIPTGLTTGSIFEKGIQLLCVGITAIALVGIVTGMDFSQYLSIQEIFKARELMYK